MKHFLVFLTMVMMACSTEPLRQFDTENHDAAACFLLPGYRHGYCDPHTESL